MNRDHTAARDPEPEDRALVQEFLSGRGEASFRRLYRRHSGAMYRFALSRIGDAGDAEDVVQEAWIRAVEGLAGFRWQSRLRTWLLGITFNCCRDLLRRRRRRDDRDPATILELQPAAPVREPIGRVDLERAIAELPDGYREVLILHDVEQLTHEEIAEVLGIRAGTSKSQLSRGRSAVRAMLAAGAGSASEGNDHARTV